MIITSLLCSSFPFLEVPSIFFIIITKETKLHLKHSILVASLTVIELHVINSYCYENKPLIHNVNS